MCQTALDQPAAPRLTDAMPGKTLTLSAVSQYLGIPRRSLYNMLKDGRFSVASIPGSRPRRWNVEDLDEWRGRASAVAGDGPLFDHAAGL